MDNRTLMFPFLVVFVIDLILKKNLAMTLWIEEILTKVE